VDEADLILPSAQDPSDTLLLAGIGGAGNMDDDDDDDDRPSKPPLPRERISLPTRPLLRRDSVPAPRQPPPATPPPQVPETNGLSEPLSLQQHVRRAVNDMPKELTPYAFVYEDADRFPHEIEEWFTYSPEEKARLARAQSSFWQEWGNWNSLTFVPEASYTRGVFDWGRAAPDKRLGFLHALVAGISGPNLDRRARSLECLVYLFLGCWQETAGLSERVDVPTTKGKEKAAGPEKSDDYEKSQTQLDWIRINTLMFLAEIGVQPLLDAFSAVAQRDCFAEEYSQGTSTIQREIEERESWCAMTLIYVSLEVARVCPEELKLHIRADYCGYISFGVHSNNFSAWQAESASSHGQDHQPTALGRLNTNVPRQGHHPIVESKAAAPRRSDRRGDCQRDVPPENPRPRSTLQAGYHHFPADIPQLPPGDQFQVPGIQPAAVHVSARA
jgi:hypothetical protein